MIYDFLSKKFCYFLILFIYFLLSCFPASYLIDYQWFSVVIYALLSRIYVSLSRIYVFLSCFYAFLSGLLCPFEYFTMPF